MIGISYRPAGRVWIVEATGETFPALDHGREWATIAAAELQAPGVAALVAELVEGRPWLLSRAAAAAELVARGAVMRAGGRYLVENSRNSVHVVNPAGGYMTCSCEDFRIWGAPIDRAGRRQCKHIMATAVATALEKQTA